MTEACGGVVDSYKMQLPYSTKHPILLPHGHKISTLVVREAHRRVFYNEVKETLTEVHRKYWKVNGRSFTKAIVHGCTVCKVPHLQGGCKVFNTGSKAPFQNNWPSRVFNVWMCTMVGGVFEPMVKSTIHQTLPLQDSGSSTLLSRWVAHCCNWN